ncbi:exodeoxyribonuclease X C-terminal domain-containing protein [Sediminibacterium salmoneum]|uniref:exodeoxyribonuclease X C-terminal domain-containing protein n=1 Tax=Sediminibacterium salmoneum TaxID=426421 RepID=UPI00055E714A|nr:hypothetical protein [Sediminibacterium salmoneum]
MEDNIFTRITFGKYKGYTIFEIYNFQPSYLEWAILNTEMYAISYSSLLKLEKPTPFSLYRLEHNGQIYWINNFQPNYDYIKAAYQYISEGNIITPVEYYFSQLTLNRMLP